MEPFIKVESVALPLATANIDTDQIIPARFLWRQRGDGWSQLLFHDLRYRDDGSPKPEFILNRPEYVGARIVVAAENFACGSSREHAVWSLYDYGIRAVIAPSFGDIFANNCYQNGLLPIILPVETVQEMLHALAAAPGRTMAVDLERQVVIFGEKEHVFAINPYRKSCLIAGTDQIGYTLNLASTIDAYEKKLSEISPWL